METRTDTLSRVYLRAPVVQAWMQRNDRSQNETAHLLGVSQGYMSQLLHGTRNPGPIVRKKLRRLTRLEWDALFETR
jgi:transcriptional regulator with XRE-family HTH domain